MGDGHQSVEFTAQFPQSGRVWCATAAGHLDTAASAVRLVSCSSCLAAQQVSHLLGVEQAWDAQVVGLLVTAGGRCQVPKDEPSKMTWSNSASAPRTRSRSPARSSRPCASRRLRAPRRRARRIPGARLAQHVVALGLHLAGQQQAGWAPTAGRCWRSHPPGASARTGRWPGRRTAVSRHSCAYTPTDRRGTSTPSDTMRTATNHRLVPSEYWLIRSEAPGSSESTTVGASPVILMSRSA